MTRPLLNAIYLALSPAERWNAAGRANTAANEQWFVLAGVATIIVLTVLLLAISYNRISAERKVSGQLFFDFAEQRGLSGRERQLLLKLAHKAGLKRKQAIFSMASAFDIGAEEMIRECVVQQGAEESRWLKTELSFLREKLGFQKKPSRSTGGASKSRKPSSRHILDGKKVYITRRRSPNPDEIEATVIKNDYMELTLKLETPVESKLGEVWRVRYSFGASVWEFDSSAVRQYDDILVLNHSDDIRFISRRRFVRARVNKPAFIAHFPFSKTAGANNIGGQDDPDTKQNQENGSNENWGPPEFVPAKVTELGGPGLRIETSLEVKSGDRVLVVFDLSEATVNERNPASNSSGLHGNSSKRRKNRRSKIIEDIGEVKHVESLENGLSAAVELTGLSDSNVNELVRATNSAYSKNKIKEGRDSSEAKEIVAAPAFAEGD